MIRWDSLMARHVAQELSALLAGKRTRALRLDGATRDLVLLFRDRALLWRLHPTRGEVRMVPAIEPAQDDLSLRARIERVEAVPDDRVLRFFLTPSRSGTPAQALVVELLGNQWNAAVVEGPPGGPEIVRHVLWRREAERAPRVGHPYRPPPPMARRGVAGDVALAEWLELLGPLPPQERPRALVKAFAWTSPLSAAKLLGAGDERREALEAGHACWLRFADPSSRPEPMVLETDHGPQPYPFPLTGGPARRAASLLAAIEASALLTHGDGDEDEARPDAVAGIGPALLRRLEEAAGRAARREDRLESELAELEDPARLRAAGDLILARYREIPPGASQARLSGFEGTALEVALDPSLLPHENAAGYYARAAKAERAAERLPGLIVEARAERTRLEEVLESARAGAIDEQAVRDLLGPDTPVERGQVAGPALPYRAYRSSGGLEIRVGRGARHNDDLTFHHSSPGDVWLHARDSAGAHVVLRWPGPGNPPARDLREAAVLAALHSKARTSGSAPVDWTLRKYVRKPRKSPPGRVVADRVETLFVEPTPELLERLERVR